MNKCKWFHNKDKSRIPDFTKLFDATKGLEDKSKLSALFLAKTFIKKHNCFGCLLQMQLAIEIMLKNFYFYFPVTRIVDILCPEQAKRMRPSDPETNECRVRKDGLFGAYSITKARFTSHI